MSESVTTKLLKRENLSGMEVGKLLDEGHPLAIPLTMHFLTQKDVPDHIVKTFLQDFANGGKSLGSFLDGITATTRIQDLAPKARMVLRHLNSASIQPESNTYTVCAGLGTTVALPYLIEKAKPGQNIGIIKPKQTIENNNPIGYGLHKFDNVGNADAPWSSMPFINAGADWIESEDRNTQLLTFGKLEEDTFEPLTEIFQRYQLPPIIRRTDLTTGLDY